MLDIIQGLPVEVLEIIASYLDGDSALELCRASHKLRIPCNTIPAWRSILDRQCHLIERHGSPAGAKVDGGRPSIQSGSADEDLAVIMHHAVSVSRGLKILENCRADRFEPARDHPTLTIACYVEYIGTLKLFRHRVHSSEKTATALLMEWAKTLKPTFSSIDASRKRLLSTEYLDMTGRALDHAAFGGLGLRLSLVITIETLNRENKHIMTSDVTRRQVVEITLNSYADRPGNECNLASALMRLTQIACKLQEAAGEPHPLLRPATPLPSAMSFPITQNRHLSQVPTPLQTSQGDLTPEVIWIKWLKSMSRSEASLDANSDWEGYYMYRNHGRVDQPMRDVELQFTTSETKYVSMRGSGTDQHGPFTLEGTINWETLRFSLRKQYLGAHAFRWYGLLTPFGMIGTWHQPRAQDPDDEVDDDNPDPTGDHYRFSLGSFWLWRCRPETDL